jgi:hypothetical protein
MREEEVDYIYEQLRAILSEVSGNTNPSSIELPTSPAEPARAASLAPMGGQA